MTKPTSLNDHRATQDERYRAALRDMPPSGGGGCHTHLLTIANYGVGAGLADNEIFRDIRAYIYGERCVPNKEITDTIRKARNEQRRPIPGPFRQSRPQPRIDGRKFLTTLIEQGRGHDECDLWEASPIRIDWLPKEDHFEVLQRLYAPDDILFIGGKQPGILNRNIRTASAWLDYFNNGGHTVEWLMPNPLTGREGRTKDGKPSFRSDDCILSFRYAIVEFDNLNRDDQLAFWWAVNLPVVALVDSGGKSIHGWIRVDCRNTDEWTDQVERRLFEQYLVPLGVDSSCRNESRLSRLPGHLRADTNRWQRLLYLNPEGGRVSA
jgi:hypothetical protein